MAALRVCRDHTDASRLTPHVPTSISNVTSASAKKKEIETPRCFDFLLLGACARDIADARRHMRREPAGIGVVATYAQCRHRGLRTLWRRDRAHHDRPARDPALIILRPFVGSRRRPRSAELRFVLLPTRPVQPRLGRDWDCLDFDRHLAVAARLPEAAGRTWPGTHRATVHLPAADR